MPGDRGHLGVGAAGLVEPRDRRAAQVVPVQVHIRAQDRVAQLAPLVIDVARLQRPIAPLAVPGQQRAAAVGQGEQLVHQLLKRGQGEHRDPDLGARRLPRLRRDDVQPAVAVLVALDAAHVPLAHRSQEGEPHRPRQMGRGGGQEGGLLLGGQDDVLAGAVAGQALDAGCVVHIDHAAVVGELEHQRHEPGDLVGLCRCGGQLIAPAVEVLPHAPTAEVGQGLELEPVDDLADHAVAVLARLRHQGEVFGALLVGVANDLPGRLGLLGFRAARPAGAACSAEAGLELGGARLSLQLLVGRTVVVVDADGAVSERAPDAVYAFWLRGLRAAGHSRRPPLPASSTRRDRSQQPGRLQPDPR